MNPGERKDDLHRLVDTLPEEKTEAAKRFLELLLGDGAVFSAGTAGDRPDKIIEGCLLS